MKNFYLDEPTVNCYKYPQKFFLHLLRQGCDELANGHNKSYKTSSKDAITHIYMYMDSYKTARTNKFRKSKTKMWVNTSRKSKETKKQKKKI